MNLVLKSPNEAPCEKGRDINVLILGEDSTLTQQACTLLADIGRNNQVEGRMISSWWNFEVLAITALRKLAASEAAVADLVVIAATDAPELPAGVVDWMNHWLSIREFHPQALVALLDSGRARKGAVRGVLAQLKKMAALGKMDFFATHARVGMDAEGTRRISAAARELVRDQEPVHPLNFATTRSVRTGTCEA